MKKWKIIALILAVFMSLAFLAACAPEAPAPEPPPEAPTPDTPPPQPEPAPPAVVEPPPIADEDEISGDLLVWFDEEAIGYALSEAFMARHPNVNITFEHVAFTDQRANVTLDGPAGIGPDVFFQPHDGIAIAIADGIVERFPSDIQAWAEANIVSSAVETLTHNGILYALPYAMENIGLFYNRAFVDSAPASFEDLLAMLPDLGDNGLRWQVNDAYHNYPFLSAFGFSIFGPDNDDYTDAAWDSEAVAQGLAFHNQFREYFDFGTDDVTWENSVAAFQRGETAFTISGPWAIADARANGVDFGTTRLPTIAGNQPHAFSGVRTVNVSSFSNNLPAAFAFAAFVASEEGFRIVFEVQGHMSALQDTSGIPGIADDEHLMGLAEQSPFTTPMPTIPQVDLMWEPLADIFTFTWNRDLSIAEAQARAMETYEMLLNAQGLSMHD